MKPLGNTAAFFYGKFHKLGIRRRRRYGEHRLTDTRNGEHCALSGSVLKSLFAVGRNNSESFYIRSVDTDIRNNAYFRNKRFFNVKHFHDLPTSS